jgi:hypothetical protein
MPDFRSDKTVRPHGTVGHFSDVMTPAPSGAASASIVQVLVSGEEASSSGASGAMALNEDVKLLVNTFIHARRAGDRETAPVRSDANDAHSYIEVALHGLNLAPHEASELHHRIQRLVHERIKNKGAGK